MLNKFGVSFLLCFFLVLLFSGQLISFIVLVVAFVIIGAILKNMLKNAASQPIIVGGAYTTANGRKPWVNRPDPEKRKEKAGKPIPKQLQQKLASRKK